MNWRAVACAGSLVPLSGCTTLGRTAAHNLVYETHLFHGEERLVHDLREDARAALRLACQQHPRKAFSPEFRDGFVDGYVDYINVGGPAQPPAVTPARYRTPKYLGPEGQPLVRDYFLGFKYGGEVAVVSGRRPYFTVPVLIGDEPPQPPPNILLLPAPPDGLSTDPAGPPPAPPAGSEPLPKPRPADSPTPTGPAGPVGPPPVPMLQPNVPPGGAAPNPAAPLIPMPPKLDPKKP